MPSSPGPWFTVGLAPGVAHPTGLDKRTVACIRHDGGFQSTFAALKMFCAPPPRWFLPPPLSGPPLVSSAQFRLFQNVARYVAFSDWLLSRRKGRSRFLHGWIARCFLGRNDVTLSRRTQLIHPVPRRRTPGWLPSFHDYE